MGIKKYSILHSIWRSPFRKKLFGLLITIWVSHPWLGVGDGNGEIDSYLRLDSLSISEILGKSEKYDSDLEN
ncbi:MAG: hypothetical protein ACKPE3_39150, partial [Sphaerospermopsis kisseleviana]